MIKLGVIGAGRFGTNILNAFSQLEREGLCELSAICDSERQVLEAQVKRYNARGYLDYRQMLETEKEINAVAVSTPDHLHREPALYAAGLGKHVMVEKPLDVTVGGCREIIEACREKNVLLQVDFHKRYDPFHLSVRQDVMEGRIGRIGYGHAYMEDKIVVPRDWFRGWAHMSSPVWFLGIHFLDLIRWILQSDAKTVYARGRKSLLRDLGIDTYDWVSTTVEFENGAAVSFDMSWILPEGFESIVNQGFKLVGENGIIECDSQDRGTRVSYGKEGVMTRNPVFINERIDRSGRIKYSGYGIESIADFVYNLVYLEKGGSLAGLSGGITALGEDGLESTRMAAAVHRSLESGKAETPER